jgi:hypothetical protein
MEDIFKNQPGIIKSRRLSIKVRINLRIVQSKNSKMYQLSIVHINPFLVKDSNVPRTKNNKCYQAGTLIH